MSDKETLAALSDISYGLYVVSSRNKAGRLNGQLANTVFQLTAQPPKLAVSINKGNLTHEYISESGLYSVSVLAQVAPMTFIGLFGFKSGRNTDKFAQAAHEIFPSGSPFAAENVLSALELKVCGTFDMGSHTLFIGDVLSGKILCDGVPLTYAYYRQVMKGKTPRAATTYRPPGAENKKL